MSDNLTHLMADLFAKPVDGKELAAKIQGLGDEIRKIVQDEETMVGKFRGLLASFETIIPDERQRYQAALQALCITSKLSRQQILKAVSGQVGELKALEEDAMPAKNAWRDALKSLGTRALQLKGQIAQLREKLAKLEIEEQSLLAGMETQEKDLAQVEKTVKELFAGGAAEIMELSRKMEEMTAMAPVAPAAAKPAPPKEPPKAEPSKAEAPKVEPPKAEPPKVEPPKAEPPKVEPPKAEPPKSESPGPRKREARPEQVPPQQDTKYRRKCPMCGGSFNLLEFEKTWQCYVCAYEEPDKE